MEACRRIWQEDLLVASVLSRNDYVEGVQYEEVRIIIWEYRAHRVLMRDIFAFTWIPNDVNSTVYVISSSSHANPTRFVRDPYTDLDARKSHFYCLICNKMRRTNSATITLGQVRPLVYLLCVKSYLIKVNVGSMASTYGALHVHETARAIIVNYLHTVEKLNKHANDC